MHLLRTCSLALGTILLGAPLVKAQSSRLDLGATYDAVRSMSAGNSQNFWMQGGSIELGADAWRGLGVAAEVSGMHAASIGNSAVPVSLVTIAFGPRFRWHAVRPVSIYAETLVGEAHGFGSLYPTPLGAQSDANSLALRAGGGIDYQMKQHLCVRFHASWLQTRLPNAEDNMQNSLSVGAGFAVRFGH